MRAGEGGRELTCSRSFRGRTPSGSEKTLGPFQTSCVMCINITHHARCCAGSIENARTSAEPLMTVFCLFFFCHFREEYGKLFDFVRAKSLRIKNTGKVSPTPSSLLSRPYTSIPPTLSYTSPASSTHSPSMFRPITSSVHHIAPTLHTIFL